ncbi:MAG TPA: ricin-type beta-trefoil lectin domain protein [Kineosporiaceae bacterium]|nr:ricin-type beta-trefoil lectin domain protein [Kineosporiaceae bacterium]
MGEKPGSRRAIVSAVILGLLVAAATVALSAGPAQAVTTTSAIRGSGSNRCLDTGTPTDGVQERIQDCAVGNANQQHAYTSTQELRVGGKCLVARANGTTAGTHVDTNVCDGTAGQHWTFAVNGSITNQLSGLCLDVSGAATAAGSVIQLWTCHGGAGQIWIRGTPVKVVGQSSARCLDDRGNPSNGIQQKIFDCSVNVNQIYMYTYGQELRISSKCLMANGSGTAVGTLVVTYDCDGSSAQRWAFNANGTITNELSGLCVQSAGGSNANNTLLLLSTCNGAAYQNWDRTGRATQTITFAPPTTATLGAGTVALSGTSTSDLTVTFATSTTSVCTLSGSTLTLVSSGTCTVSAVQAGDAMWSPATASASITVKATQAITFTLPTTISLTAGTLTLDGTTDSGLTIAYTSSTTGVCTVSGTTLTLLSTGTCTINANQTGDTNYLNATTVTASTTVKTTQAITFTLPTTTTLTTATLTLNGTTDSGLPAEYTSATTQVCTVSGSTLTILADGTCTVEADQAGDATHLPAATVSASTQIISPTVVPPGPALENVHSQGVGTSPQQVTVPLSADLTITLLAGQEPVSTVTVDGEGRYVLAASTGVITFTPVLGYTGTGSGATYQVMDSYGQSGTARYRPTVTAPPAPMPHSLTSSGPRVTQVTIPLREAERVTLLDAASNPVLRLNVPGQGRYVLAPKTGVLTFTPAPGFIGVATGVRFRVSDAYSQVGEARFRPTVTATTTPPALPKPPVSTLPKIDRDRYVPVPTDPKLVSGTKVKTKAFNSSFTGIDAYPIPALGTRLLTQGSATSLSGAFAFDSAVLRANGQAKLRSVIANLAGAKAVTCEGYADYGMSRAHEIALSAQRATVVCQALKAFGANVTVKAHGYGPRRPAVVGGTQKSRRENRRVVILVTR